MCSLLYLKEKLYLVITYALVALHTAIFGIHVVIGRLLKDNFQLYLYFFVRYIGLKANRIEAGSTNESSVVNRNN